MQAGEKVLRRFLISCCDPSELFDKLEETFNQISFCVEGKVAWAFIFAIFLRRDDWLDLSHFEARDEAVGIVAFVGEHSLGLDLGGERFGLGDVVDLSAGEAER